MADRKGTSFGIGAVAVHALDGSLVGYSEMTGGFSLELGFELIDIPAGPYRIPYDAVQGRGEAGFTLTLNERPEWYDIVGNQAVKTVLDGVEAYSPRNLKGALASGATALTLADKAANDRAKPGGYYFTATAVDALEVTHYSQDGVRIYQVPGIAAVAVDVGDTGLTVKKAAAGDWTVGDVAQAMVLGYSAAAPVTKLDYPSSGAVAQDYALTVFTSANIASGRSVRVVDFPQVKFAGIGWSIEDNAPNIGQEAPGKIIVPDNGGPFGVQYILPV